MFIIWRARSREATTKSDQITALAKRQAVMGAVPGQHGPASLQAVAKSISSQNELRNDPVTSDAQMGREDQADLALTGQTRHRGDEPDQRGFRYECVFHAGDALGKPRHLIHPPKPGRTEVRDNEFRHPPQCCRRNRRYFRSHAQAPGPRDCTGHARSTRVISGLA
jgi:hypothetical protein